MGWCEKFLRIGKAGILFSLLACIPYNATPAQAVPFRIPVEATVSRLNGKFQRKAVYCVVTNKRRIGFLKTRRGVRKLVVLRASPTFTKRERQRFKALRRACAELVPQPPPRVCSPQASDLRVSIRENTDTEIMLPTSSDCPDLATGIEIVSQGDYGEATAVEGGALYSNGFSTGSDSFTYRACILDSSECSPEATVTVDIYAREFTGRPQRLDPYKDNLSESEARYLLKKVALGGCQALVDIGVRDGLSRMVDTMLDTPHGGCTYALPLGPEYGYNSTMVRPENTDPDAFGYWMSHPRHWNLRFEHWSDENLYRILFVNARYHSPLNEYMAWMVWHPNFATYALGAPHLSKLHYNIIENNSLGFVGDFLEEFYGPLQLPDNPQQRRIPGVDSQLTYNPDKMAPDGTLIFPETGPYRAVGDQLYQTYLNNEQNSLQRPNENLGRELLEVNLAGTSDLVTGEPNYQEMDVFASTLAITGLAYDYDGNNDADGNPTTRLTSTGDDSAGPWRRWLGFFPQRSLVPSGRTVTIFDRTPFARTAAFSTQYNFSDRNNFLRFLLNDYPATARRIGAKLFTHLVHQDLDESIVSTIAQDLHRSVTTTDWKTGNSVQKTFDIKYALRRILKSQAMFSDRAHGRGFSSPFEMLVSTLRLADIPTFSWETGRIFMDELGSAGHLPLAPPNVFGWESFGAPRQGTIHDGSSWLNPTPLLGVYRGITRLLGYIFNPLSRAPDAGAVFFPHGRSGCNVQDNSQCPSAPEMVDWMLQRFNLNGQDPETEEPIVSAEERQILISYLDRPGSPWPTARLGDPNVSVGQGLAVRRLVGLTILVATHPENFRK